MRNYLCISFCFCVCAFPAQQTIAFTQYTFNRAGMNPAASGSDMDQQYYFSGGLRRQWTGFENAPKQNFVNFSYTLRPPRSYRYWQNFSMYADNDNAGLLGNSGAYLGYTFHLLLRKKYVIAFGAYAGLRQFTRKTGNFDRNDPAVARSSGSVLLYPDIIPGIRFSNKQTFVGISVRQLTITKQKDFGGNTIGSGSRLQPTIFLDWARQMHVTDQLVAMPSVAFYVPVTGIPSVEANLMYYYAGRIGGGFAVRNISFASAILQVRFLKNLSAGFSYSYPLNATRLVAQNTFEFMVGIVPYGMTAKTGERHSVSRCPNLRY